MALSNTQPVPKDKDLSCCIQGEGRHISDHGLRPSPAPRDTFTYVNKLLHKCIHQAASLFNFLFACYFGTGHSLISHLEHQKSYNYREDVRERALLPPYLSLDPSPLSPSSQALSLLPGLLYCDWLVQPGSCKTCTKTNTITSAILALPPVPCCPVPIASVPCPLLEMCHKA